MAHGINNVKRSVNIAGHSTSITLEEPFWAELQNIAVQKGLSVNALVTYIDENHRSENLSSAIRVYILKHLKN